ncbi:MAG: complex I subunit 4 family protein [Thermogutta sp.]
MSTLLLTTVLLPLLGVPLVGERRESARRAALLVVTLTLLLSGYLAFAFPLGGRDFAVWETSWTAGRFPGLDLRFGLGLDGLSVWLFPLSSLLTFTAVLVSWRAVDRGAASFYRLLLILLTGMLGVFAARDVLLFYVFFEATLIPLFFLIGIWGHDERRYAAVKFFLFTLAGSVLTFLGLLALAIYNSHLQPDGVLTFSIPRLTEDLAALRTNGQFPLAVQMWIFLALFAGFAVKVPLFPLHTWLPLAHVEAPTAGSVLLAGILLKIGGYGFLRFSLPMLPDAAAASAPWILCLAAVGILYGALTALAQSDIKRLIAYSSVAHLGYCVLGFFALNPLGLHGGLLQMVNHGLATGGLFAVVGMLYERYHTRRIDSFGGLARRLPLLAFFMFLLTFSSIGLPGLNGFAGEFLILAGMFQRAWLFRRGELALAVAAVFGVVLAAWYMLQLVGRVFFGELKEPHFTGGSDGGGEPYAAPGRVPDLTVREVFALAPLAVFIVWIGVQPSYFLARMTPSLQALSGQAMAAAAGTSVDPGTVAPTALAPAPATHAPLPLGLVTGGSVTAGSVTGVSVVATPSAGMTASRRSDARLVGTAGEVPLRRQLAEIGRVAEIEDASALFTSHENLARHYLQNAPDRVGP